MTGKTVSWHRSPDASYTQEGTHLIELKSNDDGTSYAGVNPDDGSTRWTRTFSDDLHARLLGGFLVYWQKGWARALDLSTGKTQWETESTYEEDTGYQEQLPPGSDVIVIPDGSGKHVQAVDAADGTELFRMPADYSSGLAETPAGIVITVGDDIALLDGRTGRLEWSRPADVTDSRFLVVGDRIVQTMPSKQVQLATIDLER